MNDNPHFARVTRTLLAVFVAAAASIAATTLGAHDASPPTTNLLTMEVLVNGRPLPTYPARGTVYIEAEKDREFAIRLRNNSSRRIAVALAVDGLNSIDAETTSAADASKWVLDPYETIVVSGWQVAADTARRFFFTTAENSYGEWLGRVADLGVIEAVAFRERRSCPPVGRFLADPAPGSRPSGASERAAPPAGKESAADDLAATGIGRRVDHPVRRVHLDLERSPASRVRIRYEYREQLVRLGVLPDPRLDDALERRERASGFTDLRFAPDPYAARR